MRGCYPTVKMPRPEAVDSTASQGHAVDSRASNSTSIGSTNLCTYVGQVKPPESCRLPTTGNGRPQSFLTTAAAWTRPPDISATQGLWPGILTTSLSPVAATTARLPARAWLSASAIAMPGANDPQSAIASALRLSNARTSKYWPAPHAHPAATASSAPMRKADIASRDIRRSYVRSARNRTSASGRNWPNSVVRAHPPNDRSTTAYRQRQPELARRCDVPMGADPADATSTPLHMQDLTLTLHVVLQFDVLNVDMAKVLLDQRIAVSSGRLR